jgi:hypothetical protein
MGMNGSVDLWEERLLAAAKDLSYPPTPDIATAVRRRMGKARLPGRRAWRWQPVLIAAILVIILFAGLLTVPGVRAAVRDFLQIGVVRIFLAEPTLTPTPTPRSTGTPPPTPTIQPSPTPLSYLPLGQLAGETTLETAMAKAAFKLSLPAYPPDLGKPQRVFVQGSEGELVILVWTLPDDPGKADLVLYEIAPGHWFAEKGVLDSVELTHVNGKDAFWAVGPYLLHMTNGETEYLRLITGHVLIWEQNDNTYRLESNLNLSEAVKIAESLKPIP